MFERVLPLVDSGGDLRSNGSGVDLGRRVSAYIQSRTKTEVTDWDQLVCKITIGKGE